MLGIFVIAGCVLMTCAGPPMSGYSLGTLSGGRGQEYSGYRTGGFIAMKDPQSDLSDQLGGSPYGSVVSHRHVAGGPSHSSSGSYSSDSGYSDVGSHSSAYGGQSSGNSDVLTSPSSSSYPSNDATHVSASELNSGTYSTAGSSGGLGGYSSSGGTNGNHVASSLIEYTDGTGSHGPSTLALTSNSERGPGEYSSPSHQSPSYISYTHGGPKASAYASSSSGNHRGHSPNSYSSPNIGYMAGGHHGAPSSSSFYPSDSGHSGISSGHSYASAPSLNSIIAGMHNVGPNNYIHGGSHRPSPNHIFATSTNANPNYSSRGPSSGYYSNSPYPRGGGGKIILVKESGGGHAGHMYPEQHNYSGMFGAPGSGYKIRSVASGPSYGPNVASGYQSSAGHSGGNHGGGLFGFL